MSNYDYRFLLKNSLKLVGLRQVEKGLIKGALRCVIAAFDAGEPYRTRIAALCAGYRVDFVDGPSMKELGCLCGIEIGAGVVGILKE
ncbi:MAG: ribosomal L7Ae/L30e/S12e/Gadd45 family protein [Clostridiales bacterium]|jgi:ribosomal protein L7Ae-like RNA K-turn-binding protein|nr:ribosomal L7Ae/L30e/S12e/Gadd45 family protein [Clostridiales bacterium]